MEKITSTTNNTIKDVAKLLQKKYREQTGLFIAEGEKAVQGLISADFKIKMLFVNADFKENINSYNAEKTFIVNDAVASKISDAKTPSKLIAVFEQKKYKIEEFFKYSKLVLLENIKDAGNLGTIMRACRAFDVNGIMLLGETIDLYNPKVVRASVGCFDLPVINIKYDDIKLFKTHKIYSTALYQNSTSLNEVKFETPFIIAFGSEANGLSEDFLKNKTQNIKIETAPNVESLNLASAVSICLYETYK